MRLPTLSEVLRIKAFLTVERNATRDYLDLAALTTFIDVTQAGEALVPMDTLYPQKNGDPWAVRTQLIKQLGDPRPYDLDATNLAEYKGVRAPFDRWEHVAEICDGLSAHLLLRFTAELNADAGAQPVRDDLAAWRTARESGERPPFPPLPGLKSMKHRHLTHEGFTLAAIEDILARGSMPDWAPLVAEIQAHPYSEVAEKTLTICRSTDIYGASKLFARVVDAARKAHAAR